MKSKTPTCKNCGHLLYQEGVQWQHAVEIAEYSDKPWRCGVLTCTCTKPEPKGD